MFDLDASLPAEIVPLSGLLGIWEGPGVLSSTVWAAGLVDNPAGHAITQGEPVSFIPYSELLS